MEPEDGPRDPADLSARHAPVGALNVLVVENHSDTRQSMRVFLHALGYQANEAESVAAALALTERMHFDVLLSDISLPDGDGWHLLEQLVARGTRPTHAIAMSGLGGSMDHLRSHRAGFEAHLVKPFVPEVLEEALRRVALLRTGGGEAAVEEAATDEDAPDLRPGARLRQRMHDGLCQQLAAAALLQSALIRRLEGMTQSASASPLEDAVADARHIGRVLDEALGEMRALMREIRDGEMPLSPGA